MDTLTDKMLLCRYGQFVREEHLLPIKVSDFYQEKIEKEIEQIGIGGPLYRSVYPVTEKLDIHTEYETRDYVEEYHHMPVTGANYIIQKYKDRVLFIITEECFSHCQYCFRTYNLTEFKKCNTRETIVEKVSILKNYLLYHPEIKEVILSGGDPLSIGLDNLKFVLSEFENWNIRIHTRAIVYNPFVFSEELVCLFREKNVRLIFHINHPYEICEIVKAKIALLNKYNVRMYAQFPLLRGINDHPEVLIALLELMDNLHIRPISIFITDPIMYGAAYRVSFQRIKKIADTINWNTPSWINSVRFVLDTTWGKVRIENVIKRDGNHIVFFRDGHEIDYYDLDCKLDKPGDVKIMLWKKYYNSGEK